MPADFHLETIAKNSVALAPPRPAGKRASAVTGGPRSACRVEPTRPRPVQNLLSARERGRRALGKKVSRAATPPAAGQPRMAQEILQGPARRAAPPRSRWPAQ